MRTANLLPIPDGGETSQKQAMASVYMSMLSLILFSVLLTGIANGERTKDKMYEAIEGTSACFRRLNGTHQFGCSSSRQGNVGVVHMVNSQTELDWLLSSSAVASPYMVVLTQEMFVRAVLMSLSASGKVNGVLLAANVTAAVRPDAFSPEDTCPNRWSSRPGDCDPERPWNPAGSDLLLVDWGFPMFHLGDDATLALVAACFVAHNTGDRDRQATRSLCALEMNAFMYAAVDTETCMRRTKAVTNFNPMRYCDALGDHNVWSTLVPRPRSRENTSLVVLAARMDSTSLFDGLYPGAVSPASAIVTLLATADLLNRIMPNNTDATVMFALLNGESYDYIGSSRMLYDMQRNEFPAAHDPALHDQPAAVQLRDIELFVELSQLAPQDATVFVHRAATNSDKVSSFIREFQTAASQLGLNVTDLKPGRIPPASLHTFLKEDARFPGLLLANHASQYTNKYYHSEFDDARHLSYSYLNGSLAPEGSIQRLVADTATSLARAIFKMAVDRDYTGANAANTTLVDELFHCHLDTADCPLFRTATSRGQQLSDRPVGHYVSVSGNTLTTLTALTAQTLAWLTGRQVSATEGDCRNNQTDTVYQRIWMRGYTSGVGNDTGVCIETTMNYAPAVSPAFIIDDYDWSSGMYSSWTESVWTGFSVRMFLTPSRAAESLTLACGVLVALTSFVVAFLVDRKSGVLFASRVGAPC